MKTLRLCLLVLLAVLLPVRGAVAAAMLCQPMVAGSQSSEPAFSHSLPHQLHDHCAERHHDDPASPGSPSACKLCCDFCSVTPMMSGLPTVALPQELSEVAFPDISAQAPSFVSGGQDRPPRSC